LQPAELETAQILESKVRPSANYIMDADDADLQLLVTPSFIDGPCLLCLLSGTGEHSPPVTKFTNSRQSTPHKSHPINLPSNLLPADMGIFGCVFVQAQALLAFIHRRICMPLISWWEVGILATLLSYLHAFQVNSTFL
jgi:hypothetical protein